MAIKKFRSRGGIPLAFWGGLYIKPITTPVLGQFKAN
jgi:hypothetical protein